MNLYEITQDQLQIIALLEENGGEFTPEVAEAIAITQEAFEKKAEAYSYLILKMEGESDMIGAEIKRLQALKKTKDNTSERLREALSVAMVAFGREDNKGIKRYETPTLKLSTRRSESVQITDEKAIPAAYMVIKQEVSKTLIKEAINQGIEVTGAQIVTKQSVQIK
jgi:hypothetical protein